MACALTTLPHVKQWLGIPEAQTQSDELINRLIQSASRFLLSKIARRTVAVDEYQELYDGNGKNWMLLKQWPIIEISSIQFGGVTITQELTGVQTGTGFKINPQDQPDEGVQRITLWGYYFPYGKDNVYVTYTAGWKAEEELEILEHSSGDPPTPDYGYVTLSKTWVGNIEVLDDMGVAMLKVASSPAAGQYSVDATGNYTFNLADVGSTITVVYSYVPADLEEACYELIAEGIRYKDRIGLKSKTLGGQETVVYDNSFMSDRITSLLNNFLRVAPL